VFTRLAERVLGAGRWLTLKELIYRTPAGDEVRWECLERVKRPAGVVVVARLEPSGRYVLIRQYRPGLEKTVVGFPAGLVEQGEPGAAALHELAEETGYHGDLVRVSPPLYTGAGITNEVMHVAEVRVDETLAANADPQPQLEPAEHIETVLVAETELPAFFAGEQAQGRVLGAGPWYWFAARQPVRDNE